MQVAKRMRKLFNKGFMDRLKQRSLDRWSGKWQQSLARMVTAISNGQSFGNEVSLYVSGNQAYTEMWRAIAEAKERVWLEAYIFEPDYVGKTTLELLEQAALRGCDVALIFDQFGSMNLLEHHLDPLRKAGAFVVEFEPILWRWPKSLRAPLFRNHRKVLLIDENQAFCGGMNISVDYASGAMGTGRYRDTHAQVRGPAVSHLADVLLNSAAMTTSNRHIMERLHAAQNRMEAKRRKLEAEKKQERLRKEELLQKEEGSPAEHKTPAELERSMACVRDTVGSQADQRKLWEASKTQMGVFIQVLESNYRKNQRQVLLALEMTLDSAHSHCYLTSPYFVPPKRLRSAIVRAANRGVDVRILTAGVTDVFGVSWASQHLYGVFLKNKIRLFEMVDRELHAKTVTCDGIYSMVGSYNLDRISYKHNLEVNLTFVDPRVATELEIHFHRDTEGLKEVTLDNWRRRDPFSKALHWLSYHIIRFIWK